MDVNNEESNFRVEVTTRDGKTVGPLPSPADVVHTVAKETIRAVGGIARVLRIEDNGLREVACYSDLGKVATITAEKPRGSNRRAG